MELKMKIQNRLAGIAEGLYFINHEFERDLASVLKPTPRVSKEAQ
jgi:hypothetical protein